jgi:hypothetical protein
MPFSQSPEHAALGAGEAYRVVSVEPGSGGIIPGVIRLEDMPAGIAPKLDPVPAGIKYGTTDHDLEAVWPRAQKCVVDHLDRDAIVGAGAIAKPGTENRVAGLALDDPFVGKPDTNSVRQRRRLTRPDVEVDNDLGVITHNASIPRRAGSVARLSLGRCPIDTIDDGDAVRARMPPRRLPAYPAPPTGVTLTATSSFWPPAAKTTPSTGAVSA